MPRLSCGFFAVRKDAPSSVTACAVTPSPSGKALGARKNRPGLRPGRSLTPEPGGASLFRERPLQPPSFPIAALAAICSASFLLRPCPLPTGVPFRSTSTKSACRGPDPPRPPAGRPAPARSPAGPAPGGRSYSPGLGQAGHLPAEDEFLYDLPGRADAAVQIDRSQHRLYGVCLDGGPVAAAAGLLPPCPASDTLPAPGPGPPPPGSPRTPGRSGCGSAPPPAGPGGSGTGGLPPPSPEWSRPEIPAVRCSAAFPRLSLAQELWVSAFSSSSRL